MAKGRTNSGVRVRAALMAIALSTPLSLSAGDTEIIFVKSADAAANRWVYNNPRDIAVAIRLGGATTVPAEHIVYWLRRDFEENGGCRTHFIFERGNPDLGSSVAFRTRNHAWGPFSLADSRKNVAEACAQHSFEVKRGLL